MTNRQWARFRTAFFIGILFFLGVTLGSTAAPAGHAGDWKDEIGVNTWCYSIDIPEKIISLDTAGDTIAADKLAKAAITSGECVSVPPPMGAAFRPDSEAGSYNQFVGEPVVIIKGHMIKPDNTIGQIAYVVVPLKLLGLFKSGNGASKIRYQYT